MTSPGPDFRQLAFHLSHSAQWERLLETARAWLAEAPDEAEPHRFAAQALVNLDRGQEARRHLDAALRLRPDDVFLLHLSASAHLQGRRFTEAERDIRRAIELQPDRGTLWAELAWICHQQQDRAAGLRWAAKAQELDPNDPQALNLLAICQPDTPGGRVLREKYLLAALALLPNDSGLLNNHGTELLRTGRAAEAEAVFRRALAISPRSKVARANLLLAIRRRDPVYRVLSAPFQIFNRGYQWRRRSPLGWFVGVLLIAVFFSGVGWILGGAYVAAIVLLLPVIKLYEYVTIGDLRAKAGEIGARRGGALGFRRWSFRTRIGGFAAATILFWGACAIVVKVAWVHDQAHPDDFAWLSLFILVPLTALGAWGGWRLLARRWNGWRRSRRLRTLPTT